MTADTKDSLLSAIASTDEKATQKKKVRARKAVPKKKKEEEPVYETYEDFPYEDLLVYAGIDCIVSSELLARIFPRLVDQPKYTYFENGKRRFGHAPPIIESISRYRREAFEFIVDMEINGFKFDVERCQEVKVQMEAELEELDKEIFKHVPEDLNLNSGAAIGRYLYDELGFEVINRTKGGDPSTDGDTLKKLAKKHDLDWLKNLGKRNDIRSVYTSFVATYAEDYVKPDGRIHPNYNLTGTGSFRISGDNPNLTNLPNPKHGYNVREFFIVEDGEVFITFDFSSAEVKILGALCRDPGLLKAIREGLDFHSYTAANIAGIDYEEFVQVLEDEENPKYAEYKAKRQSAKAVTFNYQRLPAVMLVENPVNSVEPVTQSLAA